MNWSVFGKAFLVETVYSIPFFILSILPFKKQLRFPIKILILFIFIGQLLQSSLYTYLISHGKPTRVTDTVFAFVSLAIYFLCVKANFWKLLFLGNFILNYFVTVRGSLFLSGKPSVLRSQHYLLFTPRSKPAAHLDSSFLDCSLSGVQIYEKCHGTRFSGRQLRILAESLVYSIFMYPDYLRL